MGETAARKRSRQESGVPWTPGWAHASGDTWFSAGGWWSQGGRNALGFTPCRASAGPPEGAEAKSLHPRWLQCPCWSKKGERGAGTPTQVRAGVRHELLCDAGGGGAVCKCLCMLVGWWGRSGQPAGRGPFAPGTIGSWFR